MNQMILLTIYTRDDLFTKSTYTRVFFNVTNFSRTEEYFLKGSGSWQKFLRGIQHWGLESDTKYLVLSFSVAMYICCPKGACVLTEYIRYNFSSPSIRLQLKQNSFFVHMGISTRRVKQTTEGHRHWLDKEGWREKKK